MKPEMHDGWGMHDPRQEGTGDRKPFPAPMNSFMVSNMMWVAPCWPKCDVSGPIE